MLQGAKLKAGVTTPFPYAFRTLGRPGRKQAVEVNAAPKQRPPARRAAGTPKRAAAKQPSSRTPLFGGLFSGGKKSLPEPKQVAQKAKRAARGGAGTSKIGGTKKIGTKRAGTSRVGGTSKVGTKRTGVPPPKRIQFDQDSSSTLGAAGVFSLGLAASAFLLFSALTGIEGPAEAEQFAQQTASKVSQVANQVALVADAGGDENTKIAETSKKVAEAAQKVPSEARSAPSPQVADASPTGRAGSGLSGQNPSQAEDSKITSGKAFSFLPQPNEVAKLAENPVEKAAEGVGGKVESDVESVPGPQGLLGKLFGSPEGFGAPPEAQESRTSPEKEGLQPSAALKSAGDKLKGRSAEGDKVQEEDKAIQRGSRYDQAASAQKNEPGSAEGNSVIDRKTLAPDSGVAPKKTTSGLFSFNPSLNQTPVSIPSKGFIGAGNEVANAAENPVESAVEQVEETAEKAIKKVPSPDGFVDKTPEVEAVTDVDELGFKRSAAFEEAAKKLRGSSEEQYKKLREEDKGIQADLDFKKAALLSKEEPGSKQGNSVFGRNEIVPTSKPGAPTSTAPSFGSPQAGQAAPNNNLLLVGGGILVAGAAAVATQQKGGDIKKEASKVADSAKEQASSAASEASSNGADAAKDIEAGIEQRKEDAQKWIKDWRSDK